MLRAFWRGLQGAAGRAGAVPEAAGPPPEFRAALYLGWKAAPALPAKNIRVWWPGGCVCQELVMHFCCEVPGEAWAELGAAEWPELRKASFAGRLGPESWRVGGAEG